MTRGIWGDPERYLDDLLAPLPGRLDARRLGLDRRRRRLVPARPLRRHAQRRRQAHRPGRVRVGAGRRPRRRRGLRRRRAARGQGRGRLVLLRAARRASSPSEELRAAPAAALRARSSARRSRPAEVRFTTALPKTRSAKIVRRAVRATLLGEDPGRPLDARGPGAIEAVRASCASPRATRSRARPRPGTTPRRPRPPASSSGGYGWWGGNSCSPLGGARRRAARRAGRRLGHAGRVARGRSGTSDPVLLAGGPQRTGSASGSGAAARSGRRDRCAARTRRGRARPAARPRSARATARPRRPPRRPRNRARRRGRSR